MEEKVLTTYVRGIYCRQCPEWIVDDLLHTRGVLDAAVSFWRAELTVRSKVPSAAGRRGEGHTFLRLTSIADSFCGCFRIK